MSDIQSRGFFALNKPEGFRLYLPFVLSALIIAADQAVKYFIVKHIPYHTVGMSFWGGFLRIIHTRNLGVAFSIGDGLAPGLRKMFFILLPLVAIALAIGYFIKSREVTRAQQWCIGGIVGGGIGNIIDRIARPDGVVDWIDVRFYGLFNMERFPTFNIADASIVVFGILLAVVLFVEESRAAKLKKEEEALEKEEGSENE
ncbi:MAG: signal peptidase II [Spirochaetales bacterium]|nr:signal peptidase II [Spirochaetales bacterium]